MTVARQRWYGYQPAQAEMVRDGKRPAAGIATIVTMGYDDVRTAY